MQMDGIGQPEGAKIMSYLSLIIYIFLTLIQYKEPPMWYSGKKMNRKKKYVYLFCTTLNLWNIFKKGA